MSATKAELRRQARRARAALSPMRREQAGRTILGKCLSHAALRGAASVFVYVSTALEVNTRELIDHCVAAGQTVLVPLIVDKTTMAAVPFPGWPAMRPGALDIPGPPPAPAFDGAIDLVFVPGLAFSADGGRLGYGGGYYDRWLAAHPATRRFGLCFDAVLFDTLPQLDHDVVMETVVSESRTIIRLPPAPGNIS